MNTVRNFILDFMKYKNLSGAKLSEQLGISEPYLCRIVKGERIMTSELFEKLYAICDKVERITLLDTFMSQKDEDVGKQLPFVFKDEESKYNMKLLVGEYMQRKYA